MKSNKNLHLNRSNRKIRHDYSAPGVYFITVNIQNSENILGTVKNNQVILSQYGEIVQHEIIKIPKYHKRIILDEWVIMPNHIHLIIILRGYDYNNGISNNCANVGGFHEIHLHNCTIEQYRIYRRNMLIPKIMGKFKMLSSKQMNIIRKTPGQKNWQNDYYDSIIASNDVYLNVKQYIIDNPKNTKS